MMGDVSRGRQVKNAGFRGGCVQVGGHDKWRHEQDDAQMTKIINSNLKLQNTDHGLPSVFDKSVINSQRK